MRRYCGRDFADGELAALARLIRDNPGLSRAELSRLACRNLAWVKPDGGLKEMSCRVAMLRMQADGLLALPAPRGRLAVPRIAETPAGDPRPPVTGTPSELEPLTLSLVDGRDASRLWNELIHRYHYLGYGRLPGAQLRYVAEGRGQWLALLSFSAAAWQLEDRDRFAGWTAEQRKRNLHLVANNSRYLILPWVRCPNLASRLLVMACRRLPDDWERRYGYRPVLLETFTNGERHRGTCYKAANWIWVGRTKGRGKLGHDKKNVVPIKDIWLCPLRPDFRRILAALD